MSRAKNYCSQQSVNSVTNPVSYLTPATPCSCQHLLLHPHFLHLSYHYLLLILHHLLLHHHPTTTCSSTSITGWSLRRDLGWRT